MRESASRDEVHVTALEVPISISITGSRAPDLLAAVREAWSWCLNETPGPSEARHLTVSLGDLDAGVAADVQGDDLHVVMEQLTSLITLASIEARSGELLMLHANGIADPDSGACVVMVGQSGAGKTTAARTLSPGRSYITDEAIAIDHDGAVVAYPKPLSVRVDGRREQVSPDAIAARRPPSVTTRVAHVLLLNRQTDIPTGITLELVPTVHAFGIIASETSYLSRLDRPLGRLAALLESDTGALRVTYREAEELDDLLSALLERSTLSLPSRRRSPTAPASGLQAPSPDSSRVS